MTNSLNSIRRVNGYGKGSYTYYPVLIVGAGESGIGLGCRLKEKLGFDQFRIFDRQAGIGGTWWINRYPNVACDVPSLFYSFSFSPNSEWSQFLPTGHEFQEYLQRTCDKYQINDKIQINTDVTELRWIEDEAQWEVLLTHMVAGAGDLSAKEREQRIKDQGPESVYHRQETVRAKVVVSAAGGLVEPNTFPDSIPGREDFQGELFHSARWKHDVNLDGKDVIVVGTGCSASQFVPCLTKAPYNAKTVTQLMRSPPWVFPKPFSPNGIRRWEKWAPFFLGYVPGLARFLRLLIFVFSELDYFTLIMDRPRNRRRREKTEEQLLKHMKESVPEKYHEILTPDYHVGCKRRILHSNWFSALNDPNIKLYTQPLTSIQPRGVTIGPGRTYPDPKNMASKASIEEMKLPADVIILANGFELTTWLHPLKVRGKGGALMQDVWDERGGAQAYMGSAMDGFPNFFMLFGPNTATGHSSVILATENMINYCLHFIGKIMAGDIRTAEVKKEAEMKWTKDLQERLKGTVYMSGGCHNWYKTKNGWNSTTYPYSQTDFSLRCMFPKGGDWNLEYSTKGIVKKRTRQVAQYGLLIGAVMGTYRLKYYGGSFLELPNLWGQYLRTGMVKVLNVVS